MNDTTIIFLAITLGFTLLVIVIRLFQSGALPINNQPPMYYRFDVAEQKITTVTFRALKKDIDKLFNENYELMRMATLKKIVNHKTKLPGNSILVVENESCTATLVKALPFLMKNKVLMIIFIPTFLVVNNDKLHGIHAHRSKSVFFENFKKKILTTPN